MQLDFTLRRFPATVDLKNACGLPFGCTVQPFARLDGGTEPRDGGTAAPLRQSLLGRCKHCFAYINGYCVFEDKTWECSVCGRRQEYQGRTADRYTLPLPKRQQLQELRADVYEAVCDVANGTQPSPEAGGYSPLPGSSRPLLEAPVYIALVDTSAEEEFVELVKSSLMAALEALPPTALFGLITFSDKIALHDVRSGRPLVRYIPVLEPPALLTPLADVLPLADLLQPVGSCKEAVAAAIEQLTPEPSVVRAQPGAGPLPRGGEGVASGVAVAPHVRPVRRSSSRGTRAFGPAVHMILDYVRSTAGQYGGSDDGSGGGDATAHAVSWQGSARVVAFLSGPPDLGPGSVVSEPAGGHELAAARALISALPPDSPDAQLPNLSSSRRASAERPAAGGAGEDDRIGAARRFYQATAAAAAALGVSWDLFVMPRQPVGLQLIAPLAANSGGCVYFYPSTEDPPLPQDVYRRLVSPRAADGLLRIRCCPQLKVTKGYGKMFADPKFGDLFHLPGTDPGDALAADLEYTTAAGFNAADAQPCTIQVAFQYTVLVHVDSSGRQSPIGPQEAVPPGGAERPGSPEAVGGGWWLQQRLRVCTARLLIAKSSDEVYQHVQSDVVATLLMHKISRALPSKGPSEARLLLRDWLVMFVTDQHRNIHRRTDPHDLLKIPVDLGFPDCEPLQPLVRLVYALQRSPLLQPSSDLGAYTQHLWGRLPPPHLSRAIYPLLTSYNDPDRPAYPKHSLSRAALAASGAPMFLLDAYVMLVVYYAAACSPAIPFPPPPQSLLRKTVTSSRQERRPTPLLRFVREGGGDEALFTSWLIDDASALAASAARLPAESSESKGGLVQFIELIKAEVVAQLRSELEAA